MTTTTWQRTLPSPLGPLLATTDGRALTALAFDRPVADGAGVSVPAGQLLDAVAQQLAEWFAGERTAFDVPLAPAGTPFQQRVWQALLDVPYGATASYGDLARRLGRPTAARAVGAANARNPLAIVIPCHRVVASDGALSGYAGGPARKQSLLAHEARHAFALRR